MTCAEERSAAEQRVGRAGRPAGEHDAVDADRRDGEHEQHRDRQVGELQRGDDVGERDRAPSGPKGITANARKQVVAEMIGATMKTTRSAAFGMMSSLSASFTPSARLCSRPNGPTRFGPGRDCIRATTRRSAQIVSRVSDDQEDEDEQRLAEDDPAVVVAEVRRRVRLGERVHADRMAAVMGQRPHRSGERVDDGAGSRRRGWPGPRCPRSWSAARPRRSGIARDHRGQRRRAPLAASTTRRSAAPTGRRPISAAVGGREPGDGPVRGPREVGLAVLQPAGVEQQVPGGQHGLTRARAAAGSAARPPGRRPARPPRCRARRSRRAPARRRAGPSSTSSASASVSSTR